MNVAQTRTFKLPISGDSLIATAVDRIVKEHPEHSGLLLLDDGIEAFAARASLIKAAEETIDVQYYFIRYDFAGNLFMGLLIEAANRGVHVRILLDDHYLGNKDDILLALSGHPNISVRTFNPFRRGIPRILQYVYNFDTVSRRMHNKSFTVDNRVTIVGGRNIGAEYFAADNKIEFGDLDVFAVGPIVQATSASFDNYWNNPLACKPEELLNRQASQDQINKLAYGLLSKLTAQQSSDYEKAINDSKLIQAIKKNTLKLEWAKASLIVDSPEKLAVARSRVDLHLWINLERLLAQAEKEVIIFSPYLIPGKTGTRGLATLKRAGVDIRILTNSAVSNNVSMVHAHYSRYRKSLLKAGVELREVLQATRINASDSDTPLKDLKDVTIHAKSFIIDREIIFIGSFNFDPRSATENTEMGIVIESEEIGRLIGDWYDANIDAIAYKLRLDSGDLVWQFSANGDTQLLTKEPHTNWMMRTKLKILGWLPIEGLM